jgi:hypothetical protein
LNSRGRPRVRITLEGLPALAPFEVRLRSLLKRALCWVRLKCVRIEWLGVWHEIDSRVPEKDPGDADR